MKINIVNECDAKLDCFFVIPLEFFFSVFFRRFFTEICRYRQSNISSNRHVCDLRKKKTNKRGITLMDLDFSTKKKMQTALIKSYLMRLMNRSFVITTIGTRARGGIQNWTELHMHCFVN